MHFSQFLLDGFSIFLQRDHMLDDLCVKSIQVIVCIGIDILALFK